MTHTIFSKKQMRFLQFFIISTFIIYTYFYTSYPLQRQDTGWIAEPAHNLVEGNGFATHSRAGWMMMEAGTFWWPPFYFMLEAITYFIFGFGLLQTEMLLLFIISIAFLATYFLAKKIACEEVAIISILLLLSNSTYFAYAFLENRPDVLVGAFNVLALTTYLAAEKLKKGKYFVIAGLLAAFATMSHPVGVFMLVALVALAFDKTKLCMPFITKCVLLMSGFFAGIMPWILYALKNPKVFAVQFLEFRMNSQNSILDNIFAESQRYGLFFGSKAMLLLGIIFLVSLIYSFRYRKMRPISLIVISYLLLFPLISTKTSQHFSAIIPLWSILAANMIYVSAKKYGKILPLVVLSMVVLFGLITSSALFTVMTHSNNYYALQEYVSNQNYGDNNAGKVVGTSSMYFLFKNRLSDIDALDKRLTSGEKTIDELFNEINPMYFVADTYALEKVLNPSVHPKADQVRAYLDENAVLIDVVCFIENTRVQDPKLLGHYYYNKSYIYGFFDVLKNKGFCLDPIYVYKFSNSDS